MKKIFFLAAMMLTSVCFADFTEEDAINYLEKVIEKDGKIKIYEAKSGIRNYIQGYDIFSCQVFTDKTHSLCLVTKYNRIITFKPEEYDLFYDEEKNILNIKRIIK